MAIEQLSLFGGDGGERLTTQEYFEQFHAANPHVYAGLVRLARLWHEAGKRRCGIRMLWERLRWELNWQKAEGEEFKLNDHLHSRYVRMLCQREPDLAPMFELRQLKT